MGCCRWPPVQPGDLQWLAALVATGIAAGYLSTLFGIGGGLIVVPLLVHVLSFDFRIAAALSLVAMTFQTPFGLWTHARRGAVDWRLGGWIAAGGLAGVGIGDWLQPQLPIASLKAIFALVMLFAAWRLWSQLVQGEPRAIPVAGLLLLGALAGVLARLLGIGGGLLAVPVLVFLGTGVHRAVASSLVPVFTNAAVSSAAILARGLDWRPAVPLAVGALVSAPLGTWTAHALPALRLRRAFALVLGLAALHMAATSGMF